MYYIISTEILKQIYYNSVVNNIYIYIYIYMFTLRYIYIYICIPLTISITIDISRVLCSELTTTTTSYITCVIMDTGMTH